MGKRNQTVQPKRTFPGDIAQWNWRNPGDESIDNGPRENVLMGHPEACGIYEQGYDNNSQHLESEPKRRDLTYVSPERMRMRAKYGG